MTEAVPTLAGIVLAAGASRRLGRPKQLVEHAGQALVLRAVEQAGAVCGAGVTVVTGADSEAVAAALATADVTLVHNADWPSGMSGSLRAGLASVQGNVHGNVHGNGQGNLQGNAQGSACSAALIMVCDQPGVSAAHLAALAALWQNAPSRPAAALYQGLAGVPVILPRGWFDRAAALQGDKGARALLRQAENEAELQTLPVPEAAFDIDTPDDLKQLGPDSDQL